jgi:hypothetical protein
MRGSVRRHGRARTSRLPEGCDPRGSPPGQGRRARTADIGITKEVTPPSERESLVGQKGTGPLEAAPDMKLGNGKVAKKAAFKIASGGLDAEEITPFTKGLKGSTFLGASAVLQFADAYRYGRDTHIASQGIVASRVAAVLEEENGEYTVNVTPGAIIDYYDKIYFSGKLEGTIQKLGFVDSFKEAKKLDHKRGYFDWSGDFVHGTAPVYDNRTSCERSGVCL